MEGSSPNSSGHIIPEEYSSSCMHVAKTYDQHVECDIVDDIDMINHNIHHQFSTDREISTYQEGKDESDTMIENQCDLGIISQYENVITSDPSKPVLPSRDYDFNPAPILPAKDYLTPIINTIPPQIPLRDFSVQIVSRQINQAVLYGNQNVYVNTLERSMYMNIRESSYVNTSESRISDNFVYQHLNDDDIRDIETNKPDPPPIHTIPSIKVKKYKKKRPAPKPPDSSRKSNRDKIKFVPFQAGLDN